MAPLLMRKYVLVTWNGNMIHVCSYKKVRLSVGILYKTVHMYMSTSNLLRHVLFPHLSDQGAIGTVDCSDACSP